MYSFKRPRVFSSPKWPLVAPSCTSVRIPALRLLGTTSCEQIILPSAEMYFRRRMPLFRTSWFLSCSSRRHSMLFSLTSSGDRDWLDSKAVITGANAGFSLWHLRSSSMSARTNDSCEDPSLRVAISNSSLWGGVERQSSNIRPHWRHGKQERASALQCFFPLRWITSKSYSWSFSSQRASWPSGSLKFLSQVSEPWSVRTTKCFPKSKRYGLKWLVKTTTARSSFLVTQYWRSALLSIRLPYATTRSHPPLSSWDSTAAMPVSQASVSCFSAAEEWRKPETGWDRDYPYPWFSISLCSPIASVQKRRNLIAMTQSRMPHHGACVVFETRCVGKTTAEELRKERRSG